jgi:hypothetical protein
LHCAHSNGYDALVAVRVLHDGDVQSGRGMDDIFCAGDAAAWPHSMADGDLMASEAVTSAKREAAA